MANDPEQAVEEVKTSEEIPLLDNENFPLILNYVLLAGILGIAYFFYFYKIFWGGYYLLILFAMCLVRHIDEILCGSAALFSFLCLFVHFAMRKPNQFGTFLLIYILVHVGMIFSLYFFNGLGTKYFKKKGITFESIKTRWVLNAISFSAKMYFAFLIIRGIVNKLNEWSA